VLTEGAKKIHRGRRVGQGWCRLCTPHLSNHYCFSRKVINTSGRARIITGNMLVDLQWTQCKSKDCTDGVQRGIQVVSTGWFVIGTRNYFLSCTAFAEHQSGTSLVITIKRSLDCDCWMYKRGVWCNGVSYKARRYGYVLSSVSATENSGWYKLVRQDLPKISSQERISDWVRTLPHPTSTYNNELLIQMSGC
jgi:hypothetical protein